LTRQPEPGIVDAEDSATGEAPHHNRRRSIFWPAGDGAQRALPGRPFVLPAEEVRAAGVAPPGHALH
jgi:hypothetical protein